METQEQNSKPLAGGAACFKDQQRICGPDCMAYLTHPPTSPYYEGEMWAHCHVLVNHDRIGRHLVIVANTLGRLGSQSARSHAEAQRNQPGPGEPR